MTVRVIIPGADLIHAMRRVTPAVGTKDDAYDFGVQLAVSAPHGEHTRRRTVTFTATNRYVAVRQVVEVPCPQDDTDGTAEASIQPHHLPRLLKAANYAFEFDSDGVNLTWWRTGSGYLEGYLEPTIVLSPAELRHSYTLDRLFDPVDEAPPHARTLHVTSEVMATCAKVAYKKNECLQFYLPAYARQWRVAVRILGDDGFAGSFMAQRVET